MANIKFIEAEANYTRLTGIKHHKKLHAKLFPNCSEGTRRDNISKLRTGKRKTLTIEMVKIICEECYFSPNELFGFKPIK